jgi:NAD(P)-dependent dehydrogenase (short-subunit alcohol dehydrogenase family)
VNEQQVNEAFAKILNQHKRVDALVNLAGGTFHKKLIQDLALAEWQEILDGNLKSTFLCCRAVIGVMKNRKAGNIVNTSSNFDLPESFTYGLFCEVRRGLQVFGVGVGSLGITVAPDRRQLNGISHIAVML